MPYKISGKGDGLGCSGYAVQDESGKTVACHPTRKAAEEHLQALYANVPDAQKADDNNLLSYPGVGVKRPQQGKARSTDTTTGRIKSKYGKKPKKINRGRSGDAKDGSGAGTISSGGTSMGSKFDSPDFWAGSAFVEREKKFWDGSAFSK